MKCQVQWIDANGKPTPDDNEATMLAHFHEPIFRLGKIIGYGAVRDTFAICAEHYAMVKPTWRIPQGGWTFEPIEPIHTYKPLLRPAHGCGLPFEWDYVEAPRLEPHIARLRNLPLSRYDHGVIKTTRPLTAEERDRFGLQPV